MRGGEAIEGRHASERSCPFRLQRRGSSHVICKKGTREQREKAHGTREKNKRMVTIPGYIYRLIKLGQGFMSINVLDWFAGNVLGIYKTMEHFTGHKK